MSDYLFFDTGLKKSNDAYEQEGTLYLGKDTGSRWVVVYDKAKEIADTGGPVINQQWLRIEPRLYPHVPASTWGASSHRSIRFGWWTGSVWPRYRRSRRAAFRERRPGSRGAGTGGV